MDRNGENIMANKPLGEVVLSIPEEKPENLTKNPKTVPFEDLTKDPKPNSPSNEITKGSPSHSPSPNKPPRPPQAGALLHKRSISKPKSRFVEQTVPPNATQPVTSSSPKLKSPNPKSTGTPKTPFLDGEDEDEEIYKKENPKPKRRCKIRNSVEWIILILAMGCLISSLVVPRLQRVMVWGLEIWKWCLMVIVIFCGRLVTQWYINVLVFMIERNFLLKKKVLYFVHGLKKSVQVCVWFGLILLAWSLLFDRGGERSQKTARALNLVSRFLASILIGSILWLVKTLLMKLLASSFHMNAFFDRIQESIFHQYVLQTLSGPPIRDLAEKVGPTRSSGQLSFRSTGKNKAKGEDEQAVIDVSKLHKMSQEKVSAWTMKGLINVIRSSHLSTLSDEIENFEDGEEQKDKKINSEWEAKAAAFRIFKNVAKPGYRYIEEEDLLRFLSKDEVEIVMPMFEGATETGKIKKSALKNWVIKAYLDRKSLAHSLNDTKTAVKQLHNLVTVIVVILSVIIGLLLMGIASYKVLLVISSQMLVVVFVFGNACKTVFEAIIFVFIMHPFDVGDRCVVDGVQMIVEEMNILTTVFLKYDSEKIYYPNSVLASKPISNFYRSPNMSDTIDFAVDMATSVESIGALKTKIKEYLESKPNHWNPTHNIVVKDIVDLNRMNMALYVKHTMNFQNIVEKNARRTELVINLKKIFEELFISYHLLPQRVHLNYTGSGPFPVAINHST
ncbi:mechanosensitive ion channel protein 10-like [Carex rostrata]